MSPQVSGKLLIAIILGVTSISQVSKKKTLASCQLEHPLRLQRLSRFGCAIVMLIGIHIGDRPRAYCLTTTTAHKYFSIQVSLKPYSVYKLTCTCTCEQLIILIYTD